MPKRTAALFGLLALINILAVSGCASVIRKSSQRVPVTSAPPGATVLIDGIVQGRTPLELRLARKVKDRTIRIEADGYNAVEIRLKREFSILPPIGNILLGGVAGMMIGGIAYLSPDVSENESYGIWLLSGLAVAGLLTFVDSGTGSGYALQPKELIVTLSRVDATSRVETLVIDAEDFHNIIWIRVRRD